MEGIPPAPGVWAGGLRGFEAVGLGEGAPLGWNPALGPAGPALDKWKFFILASMSGFIPPGGRCGFRAALTFPSGVEEVLILATGADEDMSVAECGAEGLDGTSGLPRGEAASLRASGEPSGLPVSESSAMAGCEEGWWRGRGKSGGRTGVSGSQIVGGRSEVVRNRQQRQSVGKDEGKVSVQSGRRRD